MERKGREGIMDIDEALSQISFDGQLTINCPMSRYTSFRIGGNARALLDAASGRDISAALDAAHTHNIPCFVMGNGTNLLVRDEGFDGLIIRVGQNFSAIQARDNVLTAQAGALLPQVAMTALKHSLTGLEFAYGIPGSAGGAVVMNAGAYGGEIAQVVSSALLLANGQVRRVCNRELGFGYRHSAVMGSGYVVLEVEFTLAPGSAEAIRARMDALRQERSVKQPLNLPSAGSAFKRPAGHFAAKLIDECGLKGLSVGGAQVSSKHAGFVVNTGGATAGDVIELTDSIIRIVREKTGVTLEREFIIL